MLMIDKAHVIIDEMNAQAAFVGLCLRTISSLGLRLDVDTYDAQFESSMSCQYFHSLQLHHIRLISWT